MERLNKKEMSLALAAVIGSLAFLGCGESKPQEESVPLVTGACYDNLFSDTPQPIPCMEFYMQMAPSGGHPVEAA